jgi:GNAT superfamily N-acetyltransferase
MGIPIIVVPLRQELIGQVMDLMALGEPYITVRTASDYWLYANLFSSTCPVIVDGGRVVGAIVAFRSQDHPDEVYVQDVMTHPEHRRRGLTRTLVAALREQVSTWGCTRVYLTSEPDNIAAHATWLALGFTNRPGDHVVDGVQVISNYKGPGKDRAVYDLPLGGTPAGL